MHIVDLPAVLDYAVRSVNSDERGRLISYSPTCQVEKQLMLDVKVASDLCLTCG